MKEILYVHDDQTDPKPLVQVLKLAGYEVTCAQDARRCISNLATKRPAIVIADVLLHGMNGFEFCKAIRQRFGAPALPILLLAGIYRGGTFAEEAMRCGAQQYLADPDPAELGHHVVELIGHPQAA